LTAGGAALALSLNKAMMKAAGVAAARSPISSSPPSAATNLDEVV
jgi:hypothetical protein